NVNSASINAAEAFNELYASIEKLDTMINRERKLVRVSMKSFRGDRRPRTHALTFDVGELIRLKRPPRSSTFRTRSKSTTLNFLFEIDSSFVSHSFVLVFLLGV